MLVPGQPLGCVSESDDRGQPQRSRENRDVRRTRARIGRNADDRFAIQLHGEARREIVRDEDPVGSLRQIDRIVIRQAEQDREHSDVHVDQIADSFAQQRSGVTRELLAPLEQNEIECLFRAEVLRYQLLDLSQQLAVLENGELDIEDRGFLRPGVLLGARPHLAEPLARLFQPRMKALDLAGYSFVRNDAVPHVRNFPPEKVHESVHDSRRSRRARDSLCHSALSELLRDHGRQRIQRGFRVVANRAQSYRGAAFSREHHHAHDALGIDLEVIAHDGDAALEFPRRLHDLGGRASMYPQLVQDLYFALRHQVRTE